MKFQVWKSVFGASGYATQGKPAGTAAAGRLNEQHLARFGITKTA